MERITLRQQWVFASFLVVSLCFGSALFQYIDKFLVSSIFARTQLVKGFMGNDPIYIDPIEGGILAALEMGAIPIFVLIAVGIYNKWTNNDILRLAWKVFIIGGLLGFIFGSTYTLDYQSLVCGIIH